MPGAAISSSPGKLAGQAFTRQPSDHLDLRIRVDRAGQRRGGFVAKRWWCGLLV
jgi:hypothetical protein